METQLAAEQAEVDRLETIHQLRRDEVADLRVTAGVAGVLQEVPLEEGASVTPGTNLARVGDPTQLMAELRIAETQARDVQIGQAGPASTPATGSSPDTSSASTPRCSRARSPWTWGSTASCPAAPGRT